MTSIKIIKNASKLHAKLLQKSRLKHHLFIFPLIFSSLSILSPFLLKSTSKIGDTLHQHVNLLFLESIGVGWNESNILHDIGTKLICYINSIKIWTSNGNCKQVIIGASFDLRTPLRTLVYKPPPTTNHLSYEH